MTNTPNGNSIPKKGGVPWKIVIAIFTVVASVVGILVWYFVLNKSDAESNVAGNVTGNVAGNIAGNVAGNIG
jgi:flagellar basal body-associated protein FliL